MISFFIFSLVLTFYALSALSFLDMDKAKNTNIIQFMLLLFCFFLIPTIYYIISTVGLFYDKNWIWNFILFGGLLIVLTNFPNVALRFFHIGIYLLALMVFGLYRLSK